MKDAIRGIARAVAPRLTDQLFSRRWLAQHAREISAYLDKTSSIEDRVDYMRAHPEMRSNQKRAEIIALLTILADIRPRRMCEIGADRGGTFALFSSVSAPDAKLLSLDIKYLDLRQRAYRMLGKPQQSVTCLEASSHSQETLTHVKRWLNGESLDFLFIDGDHSYDGVKADYDMYGPLVRKGGVVAFHDIVPDYKTRYGRVTDSDTGQVPQYWSELRSRLANCSELIEDPEQDGYGIGVVRV